MNFQSFETNVNSSQSMSWSPSDMPSDAFQKATALQQSNVGNSLSTFQDIDTGYLADRDVAPNQSMPTSQLFDPHAFNPTEFNQQDMLAASLLTQMRFDSQMSIEDDAPSNSKPKPTESFKRKVNEKKRRGHFRFYGLMKDAIKAKDAGNPDLVNALIEDLSHKGNELYLTAGMRHKATKKPGHQWGTGSHEWLKCMDTLEAFKRSAGLVMGVEASQNGLDWLDVQERLRSPVDYLLHRHEAEDGSRTLMDGHIPSIKGPDDKGRTIVKTSGSYEFHRQLSESLQKSSSPLEFVRAVRHIHREVMESGSRSFAPAPGPQSRHVSGRQLGDSLDLSSLRVDLREAYKVDVVLMEELEAALAGDSESIMAIEYSPTELSSN